MNKTITWNDGTTENVQIDANNIVYLNGVQRTLGGIDITNYYPTGSTVNSAAGLAFYEKELAYLASVGFRTVQVQLLPSSNMATMYGPLFNLFKKYKMLVFALISCIWYAPNPWTVTDYPIGSNYKVSTFTAAATSFLNTYSNVICVSADNELDQNLFSKNYTVQQATAYVTLMRDTIKNTLTDKTIPITTKLVASTGGNYDTYRTAFYPLFSLLCFDMYQKSSSAVLSMCNTLNSWLSSRGHTQRSWLSEFDARDSAGNDAQQLFTPAYAQAAVDGKMAVWQLWTAFHQAMTNVAFFYTTDNVNCLPTPSLAATAAALPQLQGGTGGFVHGSAHNAKISIAINPSGLPLQMKLWMSVNGTTVAAQSNIVSFTTTGASQDITCTITMPAAGQYSVYIDILNNGTYLYGYVDPTKITVT